MKQTAENVLALPGQIVEFGQSGYESLGESGQIMAKSALSTTLSTILWPVVYATVDVLGESFDIPSEARLMISWLVWGQLSYDISCVINRFLPSSTALASPDMEMQKALTEALEPEHWYSAISNAVAPYAKAAGEYYERIPAPMRFAAGATGGYAMRLMMQKAHIPQPAQTIFYSAIAALSVHKGDKATSTGVLLAPALETAVSILSKMSDTQLRGLMEFCGLKGRATPNQLRQSLQDSKAMDMALQSIESAQTRRELAPRFTPVFGNDTFSNTCEANRDNFCEEKTFTTPDGLGRNQYVLRRFDRLVSNISNFGTAKKEAPTYLTNVINSVSEPIHQTNGYFQGDFVCQEANLRFEIETEMEFSLEFLKAFSSANATQEFCSRLSSPGGSGGGGSSDPTDKVLTGVGAFFGSTVGIGCIVMCCAALAGSLCWKNFGKPSVPHLTGKRAKPTFNPAPFSSSLEPPARPLLQLQPPKPPLGNAQKPIRQQRTPHTINSKVNNTFTRYADRKQDASGFSRGGDARRIDKLLQYEPHVDSDNPFDSDGGD